MAENDKQMCVIADRLERACKDLNGTASQVGNMRTEVVALTTHLAELAVEVVWIKRLMWLILTGVLGNWITRLVLNI